MKRKFKCELVKNEEVNKLYLYGPVQDKSHWWDDEEYITPKMVRDSLAEIGDEDVEIHINTNGGSVFAGIATYNTIKAHKGNVKICVDGIAASAGSIITMAGDTVEMGVGAQLMIHEPWTIALGSASEFRKVAEDLDKISTSITDIYATRFIGDREELEQLIKDETYLTADEALDLGFANEAITEEVVKNECFKNTILQKYRNDKGEEKVTESTVEMLETGGLKISAEKINIEQTDEEVKNENKKISFIGYKEEK